MHTDELSPSTQMKDFPCLLWPAPKWSAQSLSLVWLAEQGVQNEKIIAWGIRSILKHVWLPGQQHLYLSDWSKNNSSVGVTNYKITLTNAGPVTKKASAHNHWLLLWNGFPAAQETGRNENLGSKMGIIPQCHWQQWDKFPLLISPYPFTTLFQKSFGFTTIHN